MGANSRSSGTSRKGRAESVKPGKPNLNSSQAERLALVHWRSGPDCGQYTPNCPLTWVLEFDEDTWDRTTTYAVEWRRQPKPSRGWPIHDANVLEVSCNSTFLEKCLRRLQDKNEILDEDGDSDCSTTSKQDTGLDSQVLQKLIQSVVAEAIASNCPTSPVSTGTATSTAEMVNIGYDVTIPSHVHSTAMAIGSPSRMTTMLLQAAYKSDRHLIGKSYAGQKKTIRGVVHQKPGVKRRKKIAAIQALVFKRHPTFTRSAFGQSINNYISKLSLPSRGNLNENELEDDTDEEEEL